MTVVRIKGLKSYRESGADLDDIRCILGQKTLVMAQHSSETADTSERSRAVVERLDLTRKRDG